MLRLGAEREEIRVVADQIGSPTWTRNIAQGITMLLSPLGSEEECIEKLLSNLELYQQISMASYEAWKNLQIPMKFADMINYWIDNSPANHQYLFEHRLASGRYSGSQIHEVQFTGVKPNP